MDNKNQNSYELILKQTSAKKRSIYSFKQTYPAYIILVIFIVASFLIRYFAKDNIETGLSNEFNKATNSVMNRVSAHYYKQIEVLNSMNGLYDLLVEVVKDYFELYATIQTRSYASILSVAYIPEVKHEDMDLFIINAKGLGYFDYELKTDGIKKKYYPFVNIVPEFTNIHRLGYDISGEELAIETINKARDLNKMSATEVYTLRGEDTSGLYIFYPVYVKGTERETLEERRENFQGVISLEINFDLFVKEALSGEGMGQKVTVPSDSSIIFEIIGFDGNNKEYSVFKSDNYDIIGSYEPILSSDHTLNIADQEFLVRFYSIPNYGGKMQSYLPDISFITALILSLAFFGFVFTQLTNKAKALDIAEKMTRSQRRIVDTSNDIIAVMDSSLNWKTMNPAALPILAKTPEEIIGSNFAEFLENSDDAEQIKNMYSNSKNDHTDRIDLRMKKPDGSLVWISWSFTFSVVDGLIYSIGRDVTIEKLEEENARFRTKQIETANILSKEASFSKSYFMKEMSHQLRNSLTGIEGSLQMLKHKLYETEDELDMYVDLATTSSEELLTYVTDIEDASKSSDIDVGEFAISEISLGRSLESAVNKFRNDLSGGAQKAEFHLPDGINEISVFADDMQLVSILNESMTLLSYGINYAEFNMNVEYNSYEGVVELQILGSPNPIIMEMSQIFNNNINTIIDALKYDKDDLLISMTRLASTMRLLRGNFKIDTLGDKDGNLVTFMFKAAKKNI
ncbi:MAG: CHASE domain-containing protein [Candidatus Kapabacteria bacterium]|nr:CHASE domain-containing protein [Candidatus Kapabacteria bacterium]